jgi:ABC-type dipeptide/oligopeptide/nickel transport system permease subunit
LTAPSIGRSSGAEEIPDALALAFAPLHKRAFGVAIGTAAGLVFFAATVAVLLGGSDFSLDLLSEYFYGYSTSWTGAFVGLLWGFAVGFVAGWFIAFSRNLALAISIFISRTRGELHATADFLDHI